jgi:hypothetical protein
MFLAVPIMVGVMIVCSHIPALRPVAILLSREGLAEPMPPQRPEHGIGDGPEHAVRGTVVPESRKPAA